MPLFILCFFYVATTAAKLFCGSLTDSLTRLAAVLKWSSFLCFSLCFCECLALCVCATLSAWQLLFLPQQSPQLLLFCAVLLTGTARNRCTTSAVPADD